MKFDLKFQNGTKETFTIISAVVDEMEDSAVVETVENGAMVISKMDQPEVWKNFVKDQKYKDAKIQADLRKPARMAEIAQMEIENQ